MNKTHPAAALQYAESVASGAIAASKYVQLSCVRFIEDLKRDDLHFNEGKAQSACNFIEKLTHVKGSWAAKKECIKLQPWQQFIICNLFGWYDLEGDRRFSETYIEVPRKNGKSILAAGIGLYMLCQDGEFGAEVYSGATTEKQAWEVFGPARLMVDRNEALKNHYGLSVNAKSLIITEDYSKFEPLIGKPGDGASPSCAIVDEYHEHDTDHMVEAMRTGMGARQNPLLLQITTAGSSIGGPCHERHKEVVKILEGTIQQDFTFGIIYGIDEDDDWDTEDALKKANPNWGVSKNAKRTLQELQQAKISAASQNAYRTKHLNQWVGARVVWMNMLAWQRQRKPDLFEKFKKAPCHIAVDIASRKDVAATVLLFKRDEEFYTIQRFYAPEAAAEENDKYRQFSTDGELILTPGNMTDQAFIEEDIKALCKAYDIKSIGFDDWQADYLMTRLMECRLPVINYNQTVKNMSAPMKEVEAQVLDKKLHHDGNGCMTWMMGNVTGRVDAKDNIYPRKENDNDKRCKIDGPVGLIMAMGRWLAEQEAPSVYESRGIRTL